MKTWLIAASCLLMFAAASVRAGEPSLPGGWSSPLRLAKMENVDPGDIATYEAARRVGKSASTDAVMVWSGKSHGAQTYLRLIPFTRFGDLDARQDTMAVSAANRDPLLRAPFVTQVWRRVDEMSFPSPTDPGLNELTAMSARVEIVSELDDAKRATLVQAWKTLETALAAQKYPLATVTYENSFGHGELIRIWLAKDEATLKSAATMATLLNWQLGERKSKELLFEINQHVQIQESFLATRRPELSNPGQ